MVTLNTDFRFIGWFFSYILIITMSSYHDKIAPPIATSTPKRHSGKRPSSNQKDSSVMIIFRPVKRRVKTVQIFKNLKKKKPSSITKCFYQKLIYKAL